MAKRGPKDYEAGRKLMPVHIAAARLNLDPRTVQKLWRSAVLKLGGNLFVEEPKTCEVVLAHVYGVATEEAHYRHKVLSV